MKSPLDGIKILDLTIFQNGPWGTVMLSDMGADVLKIEDPVNGDPARNIAAIGGVAKAVNAYFETMNRNKKSMTLNLKTPEGRDIFFRLAKDADVVVQNFRVGVVEKLGVDYESVKRHNPKIIYASVSGYGSKGPDAREGVFDILGQARGGLMALLAGAEPEISYKGGGTIADQMGAVTLAYAILLGIVARERHGVGQHIEVSQLGGQLILQALAFNSFLASGEQAKPRGRKEAANPVFNIYKCGDGKWIALGCPQADRYWPDACKVLGLEQYLKDPRYATIQERAKFAKEIVAEFDRVFATRPRDEWIRAMKKAGVLCAPVQTYPDLAVDPQVTANEYLAELRHPTAGPMRQVGVTVKLSATPGVVRKAAPEFGESTEEVLQAHGYSWEQIASFHEKKII